MTPDDVVFPSQFSAVALPHEPDLVRFADLRRFRPNPMPDPSDRKAPLFSGASKDLGQFLFSFEVLAAVAQLTEPVMISKIHLYIPLPLSPIWQHVATLEPQSYACFRNRIHKLYPPTTEINPWVFRPHLSALKSQIEQHAAGLEKLWEDLVHIASLMNNEGMLSFIDGYRMLESLRRTTELPSNLTAGTDMPPGTSDEVQTTQGPPDSLPTPGSSFQLTQPGCSAFPDSGKDFQTGTKSEGTHMSRKPTTDSTTRRNFFRIRHPRRFTLTGFDPSRLAKPT